MDDKCNPYLCLDGVLALAVKTLHTQVLLYQLEEKLDLPPLLVDCRYLQRVRIEHVCKQEYFLPRLVVA